MKVLVTGAGGFLGRSVVRACAAAGHDVVAMIRPAGQASFPPPVTVVRGDLRQSGPWSEQVRQADAIIHCAAAVGGDLATQFAGTVAATENLLSAVPATLQRFVQISSFSVYDFRAIGVGSVLDENSPLERRPEQRDPYTWTKLTQERLVSDHCEKHGISFAVLRPGAIYGLGKDWGFGRALRAGRFDLVLAPLSSMRLTHVDNCADAIVMALEAPVGGVFNIVDDQAPSYGRFHRLARRMGAPAGFGIYVPWLLVAFGGLTIRAINRLFFDGRARLPELFDYPRQAARWKPLRYSNRKARDTLGWSPVVSIEEGSANMIARPTPEQRATTPAEQLLR